MKNHIKTGILTIIVGLFLIWGIGYATQFISNVGTFEFQRGYDACKAEQPLLTIREIQERIGAKPDGKWGPETDELYDKAVCDQFAIACFEGER